MDKELTFLLLLRQLSKKKARKRRWYVREVNRKRLRTGQYHTLVKELERKDPEWYFRYFRMSPSRFQELLGLVRSHLLTKGTHINPIGPAERLALTLRFHLVIL